MYLFYVSVVSSVVNDHTQRSAFDDVNKWLSHWISQDDARLVAMDLQSYRNIGQGSCNNISNPVFVLNILE